MSSVYRNARYEHRIALIETRLVELMGALNELAEAHARLIVFVNTTMNPELNIPEFPHTTRAFGKLN